MASEDAKAAAGTIDRDTWGFGKPGDIAATCPKKCKREYRIHPAIGVARVGNSETEYFLGAETETFQKPLRFFTIEKDPKSKKHPVETLVSSMAEPSHLKTKETAPGSAMTDKGQVRRQAARFRIIEYREMKDGSMKWTREITSDEAEIEWEVEVANKKATFYDFNGRILDKRRSGVDIAPPAQKIKIKKDYDPTKDGLERKEFRVASKRFDHEDKPIDYLGEVFNDPKGRLIFIGGRGLAGSRKKVGDPDVGLPDYSNNTDWVDDVSDGPVKATIKFPGEKAIKTGDTNGDAWVLTGPPDFGPELTNVISMYDTMLDVAVRELTPKGPSDKVIYEIHGILDRAKADYQPHFDYDLLRLMEATYLTATVFKPANPAMKHPAVYKLANNTHLDDPTETPADIADGLEPKKHLRYKIFNTLRPPNELRLRDPDDDPLPAGPFEKPPVGKLDKAGTKDAKERAGYEKYRWTMPLLYGDATTRDESSAVARRGGVSVTESDYPRTRTPVTATQYKIVKAWYQGKFTDTSADSFSKIPKSSAITPGGLDRAALERCVGAAFYPGIEASWFTRSLEVYVEPFRTKVGTKISKEIKYGAFESKGVPAAAADLTVGPGFFTKQMAQPWHADFLACLRGSAGHGGPEWVGWWPAQRPDDVVRGKPLSADPVALVDAKAVQKTIFTETTFKATGLAEMLKHSRNVTITVGGAKPEQAPPKAIVTGRDEAGNVMSPPETLELPRVAGTVAGKELLSQVISVKFEAGAVPEKLDATVAIGLGKDGGAPDQPGNLQSATQVTSKTRSVLPAEMDSTGLSGLAKTPRPILFTVGGLKPDQAPLTAKVFGADDKGKVLDDTVNLPRAAGSIATTKKFASVTRVDYAEGVAPNPLDATVSIGFGEFVGNMEPWSKGVGDYFDNVKKWWRLGFVVGGVEVGRDPDL